MTEYENKNKWKILFVVLLGPLVSTIDASIVNVALPDMATKLSAQIDTIQWVVTSYLIVISSLILMFGRIGDLIGKAKVFHRGFIIFSFGSLMCSLSHTVQFLIASRIIQGIGASMIMSSNQGIIADTFPANERGKALGLSGSTVAIGTMLGPPIGGVLVQFFSWQSIFLINIPIGIIAFALGIKYLPKDMNKGSIKDLDIKGSISFMIFVICIFWSLSSGEKSGWNNPYIIFSFIVSIVSITLFYFIERKVKKPMIEFSIFKNRLFDISLLCAFISFTVIFCNNIIYPFYLQYAMGISPSKAGILMVVFPIFAGIVAPISGYISDITGGELPTFIGLVTTAVGLVILSFLNISSGYFNIILGVAILGIGNGLFQSPNNSIIMSLVSPKNMGIAGSINALVRNMGMVFGTSFSVVLLYNRMSAKIGYKVTGFITNRPDIFIYSMKIVYLTAASFCIFAALLSISRIFSRLKPHI